MMSRFLFFIPLLMCSLSVGCRHADPPRGVAVLDRERTLTRIAFGSCLKDASGGAILDKVVAFKPDVFVWLGDNVYIDTNDKPELFKQRYDALGANSRFQKLNATCPNLAIWDDHDYGNDNVGKTYPLKAHSKEQFGAFWKVPKTEAFWGREGIYRAYEYGPSERRVQVILLDGRTFLDQQNANQKDAYLGAAQWAWLEKVLERPAKLRLICSGVQVVRNNGQGKSWEMWGHFPGERQRLFDLIAQTKANGVVFLSGDMHFAEIYRTTQTAYPLYDVTASGLDTVWEKLGKSRGPDDFERVGESLLGENFGSIEIDWRGDAGIRLQVRNNLGVVYTERRVLLDELVVSE